jgi:hypothetical protein
MEYESIQSRDRTMTSHSVGILHQRRCASNKKEWRRRRRRWRRRIDEN